MSTNPEFLTTHRVAPAGATTYPEPSPSAAPGPPLAANLDVQVLDQRDDGWAQVACSNGWTAWADSRLLTAQPRYIPAAGIATFETPSPNQPPGARLEGGLEVTVAAQHRDGWAQVVCSNGWKAWVDGRLLDQRAPLSFANASAAARSAAAQIRALPDLYTRWLPLAGAVVAFVGSLLAWVSVSAFGFGVSESSWNLSFFYLFWANTNAFPHVGLVMLIPVGMVVAYVVAPLTMNRPVARELQFAGGAALAGMGLLFLVRFLTSHPAGLGLGAGPFVTLAGGVAVLVAHIRTRPPGATSPWS